MAEFDRDEIIRDIAHQVGVLVDARTHSEPFFTWTKARHRKLDHHVTGHAALLAQLRAELPPSGTGTDDESGPGGTEGRPPLALDVLDLLLRVEAGTANWVSVRLHRDLRETVEDNLRLLVGASTRMDDTDLKDLGHDIHGWHSAAETLTGWQSPPFTPRAACPVCERMGSLRINPEKKRGICVGCRSTWEESDGSIGLLADHIRATDRPDMPAWTAHCDHSWRLTVVSPLGISGRCVACRGMEIRRVWPRGTPAWTDLDEQVRGASA
jgi:hypothetical protein